MLQTLHALREMPNFIKSRLLIHSSQSLDYFKKTHPDGVKQQFGSGKHIQALTSIQKIAWVN